MSLKLQALAAGKPAWTEGVLAIIRQGDEILGGQELLENASEVAAVHEQFQSNPGNEVSGFLASGKKTKAALFLSDAQVKHQSAAETLRILASRAIGFARKHKAAQLTFALENATQEQVAQILQGLQAGSYSFTKYKSSDSKEKDKSKALPITLIVAPESLKATQALIKREQVIAAGVVLARDLVNETPTELYPENLAEQAKAEATKAGLEVTIYDEKRLAKENFNGILTVGRGSHRAPRLTVMDYKPAGKTKSKIHLALVGKAVTFDTGGHSLKPAKSMWEMKGDMAGGAAVIGAMTAIGQLKPSIRVTGIVPSALNAIGPNAVLPGDIIRSRSGKTVHVDNTDAEGRLLLMDALHLAGELGATHIIDAATLTGSIVRALGEAVSGMFANDDDLAELITEAGTEVGEEYWRMPLVQQYRPLLDHPVADIDNVGKSINAGAIVAALFLQEFVPEDAKWAHLDIAGCGLYSSAQRCFGAGGTGFGVRTLTEVALRLDGAKAKP